jgi:hypothetical protein
VRHAGSKALANFLTAKGYGHYGPDIDNTLTAARLRSATMSGLTDTVARSCGVILT